VAFRRSIISAAILWILGSLSIDSALASGSYDFDLPEQSLAESLRQIAQRAAMNILFDARSVETMRAPAIKGVMSAEEALQKVLAGTDLVFEAMGRDSVLVKRQEEARPRSTPSPEAEKTPLAPPTPAELAPAPVPAGLEEITVHAQRREENLQTVPITVDTVSGKEAAARGTTSIWTLVNTIPNLTFTTGGDATNTYIRGVGDNSVSPNNEPSVAVYVDGVYNASSLALTSFNFYNIQQIEVLKGPQGTLFGRNATAGVIQIITPDPKFEFGGKADVGYGNYATYSGDAYVTGGLTDKLAGDLALLYNHQIDGFGRDLTTNTPTDTQRSIAARSKWLYDLSKATKIRFMADYSDYDSGGLPDQFVSGSYGANLGPFNVYGTPTYNDTLSYGASVRVDQDIGEALHGVSISSYRWVSGDKAIDSDFTSALINEIHNHNDSRYWTQELQLTNRNPGPLTWLAGAFYYGNQVFGADPWLQTGTQIAAGYRAQYGVQDTASGSVFGQATAALVADTKLTLGLRYTDETLKAFTRTQDAAERVIAGPFAEKIRSDPLTWRVALEHPFGADLLGYVSYNRGFKSGGFNLTSPGSAPFYPEHIDAYETGLKSEFLDHRVRLNVAAFYYHYTDLQVAVSAGGAQLFENAAKARNYGMDGSFDFAATDQLTLSTGVGLLSARYVDYPNARGFTILGAPFTIANAKGADLPFAPPVTGFVSSNYRVPTSSGEIKATANLSYTARSYVTPDDGLERPTYWMLNATLEWRLLSDHSLAVRLWGKNLTNADYDVFATEGPQGWYRSEGPPRTYGLTVEKVFY
jgi:iron complex outermembrane receptor protein